MTAPRRPVWRPSRRALLSGLLPAAAALGGCAQQERADPAGASSSSPSSATPSPSATASPSSATASPSATASAVPAPTPDRAAILREFAGAEPAYWGEHPVGSVSRFQPSSSRPELALTFDACGGEVLLYDRELIRLLRSSGVKATLFINHRWAGANRATLRELAADPLFEIANHGTAHVPLTVTGASAYGIPGTSSLEEVWEEIMGCTEHLLSEGIRPRFFRPGTAYADDVASRVATRLGQPIASYAVNADLGATAPAAAVASAFAGAPSGSVVIAHMNRPGQGTAEGLRAALPALRRAGTVFKTMSEAFPSAA